MLDTIKAKWAALTASMEPATVKLVEYGVLTGAAIVAGSWAWKKFGPHGHNHKYPS